jgi:ribosomal protein L29
VKEDSAQRDTDLDELRKELMEIKKKLAEQETERTRQPPSTSPK